MSTEMMCYLIPIALGAVILFLYWLNDHESQDEWEYQEKRGAFSTRRGNRNH
jgi:hypothetical protein